MEQSLGITGLAQVPLWSKEKPGASGSGVQVSPVSGCHAGAGATSTAVKPLLFRSVRKLDQTVEVPLISRGGSREFLDLPRNSV
jgi:hypothetical protein